MDSSTQAAQRRHLGIWAATGVGVAAIVGGGILALAGAALAVTGPSTILAFALNGVIAFLCALSFAEVSSKFPESGGTYVFAKKVLTVEVAFAVGWVVWFASIVAAVLYALGFAQFTVIALAPLIESTGGSVPEWWGGRWSVSVLAMAASVFYASSLSLRAAGGGQFINVTKVAVFLFLIAAGLVMGVRREPSEIVAAFRPFLTQGWSGLLQAMGFTFIALQGFDLIAAVAGEIKEPQRTIPRAMFLSLSIALIIYLPLLLVIVAVGVPAGTTVTEAAAASPEGFVAVAAGNYLGSFGYTLVVVAGILSMLSALQANIFAASRVAQAMSLDRTLPPRLARTSARSHNPVAAIWITTLICLILLCVLPNVADAGAASSLIFLITFSLVHWIAALVRLRSVLRPPPFRTPWFPAVPVLGGLACLGLSCYQGWAVPAAGRITVTWLSLGGLLFIGLFARRARRTDASAVALDPELVQLRGRSPLVLVPVANPANARSLVTVAHALAPPRVGRVLLLSVIVAEDGWLPGETPQPLVRSQEVLGEAITAAVEAGLYPETLATIAGEPWYEIARVAEAHRCQCVLIGLSHLEQQGAAPLNRFFTQVNCDVVVLRAPSGWQIASVVRVLVPIAGRTVHETLLARLLSSLVRSQRIELRLLRVVPTSTTVTERRQFGRSLRQLGADLGVPHVEVDVVGDDDPLSVILAASDEADLVVLGAQRVDRRRHVFGQFTIRVAQSTTTPLVLISRKLR